MAGGLALFLSMELQPPSYQMGPGCISLEMGRG